jgi:AcrR family transcriptional regulator
VVALVLRVEQADDRRTMNKEMSLRERKKLATRTALIEAAQKLFLEKGYEKTTLEDICAQVPIHVTTFFSYFEGKEELAFAKTLESLKLFTNQVRDRPAGVDVITTYWKFFYSFDLRVHDEEREIMFLKSAPPMLRNRYSAVTGRYAEELARALAEEAGREPGTDLYSKIYAATLIGTFVAGAQWLSSHPDPTGLPSHTAAITQLILSRFPTRAEIEAAEREMLEADNLGRRDLSG